MAREWWKKDSSRAKGEQDVMKRRFGDRFDLREKNGRLQWIGKITSQIKQRVYIVRLVYPKNYPKKEIKAYIDRPHIKPSLEYHMFNDGHLCLEHTWKPTDTAVKFAARTAGWILSYEYYQRKNEWKHPNEIKKKTGYDAMDTITPIR